MFMSTTKGSVLGAAAAMFAFAMSSEAAVIGTFVDQGGGVFRFDVTNNDAVAYSGFNFGGTPGAGDGGFSGSFSQALGNGTITFNTEASGSIAGIFAETYFFGATPTTSVNILDTTTSLEGAYDYGTTLIAPGQTITAAIFTTTNNTVPTFIGGFASNTNTTVPIVIPEPASLAAIGLAGLLGLKRRRRTA